MRRNNLNILTLLFVPFPGLTGEEVKALFDFKSWGKSAQAKLPPYEQNRLYFTSGGSKINYVAVLVWLLVCGVLFTATGGNVIAIIVGALFATVIILLLVFRLMSMPKVTRQEVETNIGKIVADLKQEGLDANGIDESQVNIAGEPLCISQYLNVSLGSQPYMRDGMCSNITVTYFYVGIDQLYIYNAQCSVINPLEKRSMSNDYFYRDIMSSNIRTDVQRPDYYILELVFLNGRTATFEFFGGQDVQQTLFAIKNLIRDKRNNY